MTIKLPLRSYLTFDELLNRWQCSENDLRYQIITGQLKPSVVIDAELFSPRWVKKPLEGIVAEDSYRYATKPRGWQYLQDPVQTAPFDCRFCLISDERDADKPDAPDDLPFAVWHWLPEPMTLEDVKKDAVFLLSEIATFEEKHSPGDSSLEKTEIGKIHPRTEKTYLAVIGALLELMLAPKPGGGTRSGYVSQAAIIEGITAHFPNKEGLSDRNLEKHFSRARQSIQN